MKSHIIHIQKWARSEAPSETDLYAQMLAEGLDPYKWHSNPQDVFPAHDHPYEKIIMVVDGSITFGFPIEGEPTTLYPGDRLVLPQGVMHNAVAGKNGVVCLEAQRSVK
ncbi:MAG: cupin domain-containing protein [Anaerolineales bacterium]|nr:cupin domain-containing protein [Anaerolineales bacterium]MCB8936774.1 cupin domain-containing protein [Ardenticatenaceae bacterium]